MAFARSFGAGQLQLWFNQRFYRDYARLSSPIAKKVDKSLALIRHEGLYHPSLHTRNVEGNPDARFRFLNVDNQFRMVVVLEGHHVVFERVGNHDEVLAWGARATLREYTERLAIDPADALTGLADQAFRPVEDAADAATTLFGEATTIPEILDRRDRLSDLLVGDLEGSLAGYRDGKIEDWMIFLSPLQRRAVDRAMDGPSRVTGGPGTGKTVVGLHLAARFAREADDGLPVLLTSYVKTVPEVLLALFERLEPNAAGRVQASSIHGLALQFLQERGSVVRVEDEASRKRFAKAHVHDRERYLALHYGAGLADPYLWDEVTRVIEGRGVTDRAVYLALERHGRRRPLIATVRAAVWSLYVDYRAGCDGVLEGPVVDFDRVMELAATEVVLRPEPRFSAIVVDEAQDISEAGLRFLVGLLEGGAAGQIVVIGDNGQRIYPGGYRLADLALEVRGRSHVLGVCYRSTDEVMQAVGAVGRFVSVDEFGEDGLRSMSTSTVRTGARPELHRFATAAAERAWVIEQLDPDDEDLDATAILVDSNNACEEWAAALHEADLGFVRLLDYHGRPTPGVKVGTLHRAKGLEFKTVHIPGLSVGFGMTGRLDADDLIEKGSLLYAAMSRARDRLILSHWGEASDFVEAAAPQCDVVDHRGDEAHAGEVEAGPVAPGTDLWADPGPAEPGDDA